MSKSIPTPTSTSTSTALTKEEIWDQDDNSFYMDCLEAAQKDDVKFFSDRRERVEQLSYIELEAIFNVDTDENSGKSRKFLLNMIINDRERADRFDLVANMAIAAASANNVQALQSVFDQLSTREMINHVTHYAFGKLLKEALELYAKPTPKVLEVVMKAMSNDNAFRQQIIENYIERQNRQTMDGILPSSASNIFTAERLDPLLCHLRQEDIKPLFGNLLKTVSNASPYANLASRDHRRKFLERNENNFFNRVGSIQDLSKELGLTIFETLGLGLELINHVESDAMHDVLQPVLDDLLPGGVTTMVHQYANSKKFKGDINDRRTPVIIATLNFIAQNPDVLKSLMPLIQEQQVIQEQQEQSPQQKDRLREAEDQAKWQRPQIEVVQEEMKTADPVTESDDKYFKESEFLTKLVSDSWKVAKGNPVTNPAQPAATAAVPKIHQPGRDGA